MTDKANDAVRKLLEEVSRGIGDGKVVVEDNRGKPEKPKTKTEVLIIYEGLRESIIADACTFGFLMCSAVVCWWLETTVLQWLVGLMLVLNLLHGFNRIKKKDTYTIAEARSKLDELEKNFPQ